MPLETPFEAGDNVVVDIVKNIMTITIDLTRDLGLSNSKRSRLIATTRGTRMIDDYGIGLNVFRPNVREKRILVRKDNEILHPE